MTETDITQFFAAQIIPSPISILGASWVYIPGGARNPFDSCTGPAYFPPTNLQAQPIS